MVDVLNLKVETGASEAEINKINKALSGQALALTSITQAQQSYAKGKDGAQRATYEFIDGFDALGNKIRLTIKYINEYQKVTDAAGKKVQQFIRSTAQIVNSKITLKVDIDDSATKKLKEDAAELQRIDNYNKNIQSQKRARGLANQAAGDFRSRVSSDNGGLNIDGAASASAKFAKALTDTRNRFQLDLAKGFNENTISQNRLIEILDKVENRAGLLFKAANADEARLLATATKLFNLWDTIAEKSVKQTAADKRRQDAADASAKKELDRQDAKIKRETEAAAKRKIREDEAAKRAQDRAQKKATAEQIAADRTVRRQQEAAERQLKRQAREQAALEAAEKRAEDKAKREAVRAEKAAAAAIRKAEREEKAALRAIELANKLAAKEKEAADVAVRKAQAPGQVSDLNNQLGGIRGTFTGQGVLAIQRANLELQKFITTSTVSKDRLLEIFAAIKTGSTSALGTLSTEELKAEVALRRLVTAFNNANDAGKRTTEMMLSFRTAARLFVIQQVHLAISKMTNAFVASVDAGKEFEIKIGEIKTITLEAMRSTEEWSAALVGLSNRFGVDLLQTTEAAYEALSNQISKGAGVTVFLSDAFALARTTASTVEQSVNVLSSAINAYGTSAVNAARYSAVLFKVADLGRVRIGQIANTFGNTATLANNVGIAIEDLGAAFATLTIQGIRPDTSLTLVNNIILKLLKPTKEMTELFKEWGVASGEAAIATYGFQGVLARIDKEFRTGGVARLGEIASDMRAIRGQVGLTGQAFGKFQSALIQMKSAQEDFDRAAELTSNTLGFKLNKELAQLNNLFVADVVQNWNKNFIKFNEAIGGSAKSLKPFADAFTNTQKIVLDSIGGLISYAKMLGLTGESASTLIPTLLSMYAAYKAVNVGVGIATTLQGIYTAKCVASGIAMLEMTTAQKLYKIATDGLNAALATELTLQSALTLGIPLLIAGITYWVTSYEDANNKLRTIAADTANILNEAAENNLKLLNKNIDRENELFKSKITERFQLFLQYAAAIKSTLGDGYKKQVEDLLNPLKEFRSDRAFELKLIGIEETSEKLSITKERIGELGNEIRLLAQSGNMEAVEDRFKQMGKEAAAFTDEAVRGLDKINKEIKRFEKDSRNKKLENELSGLTDPKKVEKIQGIVAQLRKEAAEAAKKGDLDSAKEKLQEAEKLNDKLIAITGRDAKKGKGKQQGVQTEEEIRQEQMEVLLAQRKKMEDAVAEGKKLEEDAQKRSIEGVDDITKRMIEFATQTKAARDQVQLLQQQLENLGKVEAESKQKASESKNKFVGDLKAYVTQTESLATPTAGGYLSVQAANNAKDIYKLREELKKRVAQLEAALKNDPDAKIGSKYLKEVLDLKHKLDSVIAGAYDSDQFQNTDSDGTKFENRRRNVETSAAEYGANQGAANEAEKRRDELVSQQNLLQGKIDESINAIKQLAASVPGALEKFNLDFSQPVINFKQSVDKLDQTSQAIIKALIQMKNDSNGGRKATGGMLGYASGGRLGRDNITYRGHEGEGVMNKESMHKFYPQYAAMNSGGSGARGLGSSGPSIQVGDVNIHMASNNTQQNVNEFGRGLRRAIRAGTVRLS